ncbi:MULTISPECIES: hypothetical protein [Actinomadura]|uniref:Uncharacterized protein n=1 Tax=Actinomadura miaoliensis TaxID=430685 RepID=A0ABP7X532_9ACTN
MIGEMNPAGAAAALEQAERLGTAVRRHGRWLVRYQLGYGVASFLVVLMLGVIDGPIGIGVSVGVWGVVITLLSVYAARQPVAHRGMARAHSLMIATWAALYGLVLSVGVTWFDGRLAWWLPGAVVVASPGLVSAYLTHKRIAEAS